MIEPTTTGDETLPNAMATIRRGLETTPQLLNGIVVTGLIGVVVAAGGVAVPVVIQQAIDRGGLSTGEVDLSVVVGLAVAGLVIVLGISGLALLAKRRLIVRAESALRDLRVKVFEHVHKLSLADHHETNTGVLISRVTSDVDSLSRFAEWGMFTWLVQPVVVVGTFVAMAAYSWPLAVIALTVFLPLVPILRAVQIRMMKAHDDRRTAVGVLLGAFGESLAGAEVVRAYGAQPHVSERIQNASENRYRTGIRANAYMAGVYVVGDMFAAVMLVVVLAVGLSLHDTLGLTSGELVALLFLTTLLQRPIAELGETLNNAQEAVAGWRKVLDLLDTPIDDFDPAKGLRIIAGPMAFEAHSVGFAYRGAEAVLRDVSVSVPAGARVAVVGETGSGKSTFARLLCRLADPTNGYITVGGQRLDAISEGSRQSRIRLVPQDGFLFDTSIRANIGYGRLDATESDIAEALDLLDLGDWVDSMPLGLDTRVGERGGSLSVGERQLVCFARAAVADPGLLILDEATSSVDPQTDRQLTRALDRLAEGRTIVSIAHRLSTAENADVILVFDAGSLVEQGSHDELLTQNGIYARLHQAWTADSRAAS